MNYWNLVLLILSVILLIYILYNEWFRLNKSRKIWRLLAGTGSVLALLLMIFPLSMKTQARKGTAIVLTEGYNEDSLSRFLLEKHTAVKIYVYGTGNVSTTERTVLTDDPFLLKDSLSEYDSVHVFGNGFYSYELDVIKNIPFIFHSSLPVEGINTVSWPRKIIQGETFKIRGSYSNHSLSDKKIILKNASVILDSITAGKNNSLVFEFSTIPEFSGRGMYSLAVLSNKDTTEQYNIPVEVKPVDSISILMLSSSPDFENRFLQNFLYQNGYSLAIRTSISTNKYDYRFLNIKQLDVNRINTLTLSNFDVLITDAASLNDLSQRELNDLSKQIENNRLGLLIRTAEPGSNNRLIGTFRLSTKGSGQQVLHTNLSGMDDKLPPLTEEKPYFIKEGENILPLVETDNNEMIAGTTLHGSGRIVLTTIGNSYRWALAGYKDQFAMYWSHLIKNTVMKKPDGLNFQYLPAIPVVNEPVIVQIISPGVETPEIEACMQRLSVQQHPEIRNRWNAEWWPVTAGWNYLKSLHSDTIQWVYVFEPGEWKSVISSGKISATELHAKKYQAVNRSFNTVTHTEIKTLPTLVYFLLFVISAGYLWYEKKYFS